MFILASSSITIFQEYGLHPVRYMASFICAISPALYALLLLKYNPIKTEGTTAKGLYEYNGNLGYRLWYLYAEDNEALKAQCIH